MRLETLADCDLMRAVKAGDQASFELLHQRHKPQVYRLLNRMTRDAAVAEELAQEVFLRVYQARDRYEPTASFSTWLYRIAFNRALNWIRSQRASRSTVSYDIPDTPLRRTLMDGLPDPEYKTLRREVIETVRRAIEELPPRQRTALILHKYYDFEYMEIAAHLGVSLSAVKSLLFRTYLGLHKRLEEVAKTEGVIAH
jgi:RNA polymerase sigma-70 factor (ECF subfamily)